MKHSTDSSYGRLSAAWLGASALLIGERVVAQAAHVPIEGRLRYGAHMDLGHAPWVLVARQLRRPEEAFYCGLLASLANAEQVYRIDPVSAASIVDVGQWCRVAAPRLLLIDAALLHGADPRAVHHLRHRMPATDWIIVGDEPPSASDVASCGWARGWLDWSVDTATLARALDLVMDGRLWFPRALVESLYLTLLGARAPLDMAPTLTTPAPLPDEPLTTRETEVLALMRQGMSNKQIAERLEISVNTVKKHLMHAFEKRGIHKRRQAVG